MSKNEPSNHEMMIRILEQEIELLKMQNKTLNDENIQLKARVQSLMFGFVLLGLSMIVVLGLITFAQLG